MYITLFINKVFLNIKMSRFVGYNTHPEYDGYYIYEKEEKQYAIAMQMLNYLFKTHGYCVDPGDKSGIAITHHNLEQLKFLANINNDHVLLNTIAVLRNGKAPSPRMVNDEITHEISLNEKHRYHQLNVEHQENILSMLKIILNIGLYLGGWNGGTEPYITSLRCVNDVIRVELKINPLIQSLYVNPNYPLIKNFPIIKYYIGRSYNSHISNHSIKPSIIDNSTNIDSCLNNIALGVCENCETISSNIISTSYYYITTICNIPLPMLEPLIISLV